MPAENRDTGTAQESPRGALLKEPSASPRHAAQEERVGLIAISC
jgi:hypothetical protein